MLNHETKDKKARRIKCVVWDLDDTLWDGVLSEDLSVTLKQNVLEIIKTLDSRGILHSIASKNDERLATSCLKELGTWNYFVAPQINWNAKSESIRRIGVLLNIALDSIAFVDDQQFEQSEVSANLPEVLCISASLMDSLLSMPEMNPPATSEESRQRRGMYQTEIARKTAQEEFQGPTEEFLASLHMTLSIAPAQLCDLTRAEELTLRTNQLNTTGQIYDLQQLAQFSVSKSHFLYIIGLEDRFGDYGKIGLTLVERTLDKWCIKLLLMSCRVISSGIGTVVVRYLIYQAHRSGVRLVAEFLPTDRNRIMYMTYRLMGFKELENRGQLLTLEVDVKQVQAYPEYVKIRATNITAISREEG